MGVVSSPFPQAVPGPFPGHALSWDSGQGAGPQGEVRAGSRGHQAAEPGKRALLTTGSALTRDPASLRPASHASTGRHGPARGPGLAAPPPRSSPLTPSPASAGGRRGVRACGRGARRPGLSGLPVTHWQLHSILGPEAAPDEAARWRPRSGGCGVSAGHSARHSTVRWLAALTLPDFVLSCSLGLPFALSLLKRQAAWLLPTTPAGWRKSVRSRGLSCSGTRLGASLPRLRSLEQRSSKLCPASTEQAGQLGLVESFLGSQHPQLGDSRRLRPPVQVQPLLGLSTPRPVAVTPGRSRALPHLLLRDAPADKAEQRPGCRRSRQSQKESPRSSCPTHHSPMHLLAGLCYGPGKQ
ncbi:uncharacterized protein [Oryctolagus cuniculus]|uniref:uncharacterized protein n=1 Tax=Oryctolagus cuniculus TaxID=9986 RepID=UPI00387A4687